MSLLNDPLSPENLFKRLRLEHEQAAPEFDSAWNAAIAARDGAVSPRRSRMRSWAAWAAPAGLAAGIAIAVLIWGHGSSNPRGPGQVASTIQWRVAEETVELPWQSRVLVSQWESPTHFLMDGSELKGAGLDWR